MDYADARIGRPARVVIRDDDGGLGISGLPNASAGGKHCVDLGRGPRVVGETAGDVLWTVEGDDAARFEIDSETGELTLPAQNFEEPADKDEDNVYDVTVRATDEDERHRRPGGCRDRHGFRLRANFSSRSASRRNLPSEKVAPLLYPLSTENLARSQR